MAKQSEPEVDGVVERVLGNNNYLVRVTSEKGPSRNVMCHLAGKMRQFKIKVIQGDAVRIVIPPPYDKGRIVYRDRKG